MNEAQAGNPLHGITLKMILDSLVTRYGWEELGQQIDIRCFTHEPSVASSLKFLRRTPWAREQVEALYLRMPNSNARQ
ncbi:MAG: VF530 family protein [Sulfuritalea sp.]|nr:VF530 family protein [Sulfuritalea sp.]